MEVYCSSHLIPAEMCVTACMASVAKDEKRPASRNHVIQHCIVLPRGLGRTQGIVRTGSERRHKEWANTCTLSGLN